jgi:recyclin-1
MYIDEKDIFSEAVKEKKQFEHTLDDFVAIGLDKGLQVLMDHIEYIFVSEQMPQDFNFEQSSDFKPTKVSKRASI